jgi:lipopolysaccharide export LptBFGC system permease protein LptF
MAAVPGIRIGDADREALAGELREHYAHGRLTLDEFQHRLDATFAARTDADLRRITADLPHQPASSAGQVPSQPPMPAPSDRFGWGQQAGSSRRRSAGAFVRVAWMLAAVALVALAFSVFRHAGHPGRLIFLLLAVLAVARGFVRRLLGGGRPMRPRRRTRPWRY